MTADLHIDFQRDEVEMRKFRERDGYPDATYLIANLYIPVRFVVDGTDIFEIRPPGPVRQVIVDGEGVAKIEERPPNATDDWRAHAPLADLALGLANVLGDLSRMGEATLDTDGPSLRFRRIGDTDVEIRGWPETIVRVRLDPLRAAIRAFVVDARAWLEAEAPELVARPDFLVWFPPIP